MEPSIHGLEPVVQQLVNLITKNRWEDAFAQAISNAGTLNIPALRHIRTLDDYLNWINALLRWVPSVAHDGAAVRNRISEFYFLLDQPPVRALQDRILPHEKARPLSELSAWIVDFADAWGLFLDTTESLTPESLQTFYEAPSYNMQEYMPAPSGWRTFNQFFARHTKPGMRPIAAIGDDTVIVSPADSTFVGSWQINERSQITVKDLRWSVMELLEGSAYKDRFRGGMFTHSYLNTTDYHRLHVPLGGRVVESRVIHGQAYYDVQAQPATDGSGSHSLHPVRSFEGLAGTGYQFAQARGLLVLETRVGLVAVMPIGMAQVSSVVMTAEEGKTLHKGEEFAYFQFGGSDHIVLFEAAVNPALTARVNVHYNQGACIGYANP